MKAIKLALTFLRIGILNELQYRVNFLIQILESAIALGTGLIGLWLVFSHTTTLNGWSATELLVVMGVHILMGGVINSVIQPNMQRLMDDVQAGTLDFALTKPVDSQLLISVRQVSFWRFVDVLTGLIVLGYAISQFQEKVGLWQALGFTVALVLGGVIVYCFWLMLTSTTFWIIRAQNMVELFQGLYAAGRWPVSIYPNWLRNGLTFIVPVAFAVTVPAEALTNRLTALTLAGTVVLTLFFLLLARGVWQIGLKNYSGASA